MKLKLISFSRVHGGAAIASSRLLKTIYMSTNKVVEESYITQDKAAGFQFFKRLLSFALSKLQFDSNPIKHSLNLFSYAPVLKEFKQNNDKIFHLHWINNDTLSIFSFDKIPLGSIITLHDEWLYCGAEHCYKIDDSNLDFVNGYQFFKKGVWGIHWNYLIWKVKLKKLNHTDLIYTVPSSWMLARATQSLILHNADIRLLPNPIDVDKFISITKIEANKFRSSIGLLPDDFILVFGAMGGKTNPLKGVHLLEKALKILSSELSANIVKKNKLINFGGKHKETTFLHGFENISLGHISEQSQLALLYSSADCIVVPSLVESFGQVAAEALACETPVVCFNYSGLTDIVIDGFTGLLAEPYNPADLADKVKKMILMSWEERMVLGKNGRKHVIEKFSYPTVLKLYSQIIDDAINLKTRNGY